MGGNIRAGHDSQSVRPAHSRRMALNKLVDRGQHIAMVARSAVFRDGYQQCAALTHVVAMPTGGAGRAVSLGTGLVLL